MNELVGLLVILMVRQDGQGYVKLMLGSQWQWLLVIGDICYDDCYLLVVVVVVVVVVTAAVSFDGV